MVPFSDSEPSHDPDSLNIAAVVGAVFGAFLFVASAKAIRGK